MEIKKYISIITLNLNKLNALNKRQRLSECIKKKKSKTQIYAAYKELTIDLKTHIVSLESVTESERIEKGIPNIGKKMLE